MSFSNQELRHVQIAYCLRGMPDGRQKAVARSVLEQIPSGMWNDDALELSFALDEESPNPGVYGRVQPLAITDNPTDSQTWEIQLFRRETDSLTDRDLRYLIARALSYVKAERPWDSRQFIASFLSMSDRDRETDVVEERADFLVTQFGFSPDPRVLLLLHG